MDATNPPRWSLTSPSQSPAATGTPSGIPNSAPRLKTVAASRRGIRNARRLRPRRHCRHRPCPLPPPSPRRRLRHRRRQMSRSNNTWQLTWANPVCWDSKLRRRRRRRATAKRVSSSSRNRRAKTKRRKSTPNGSSPGRTSKSARSFPRGAPAPSTGKLFSSSSDFFRLFSFIICQLRSGASGTATSSSISSSWRAPSRWAPSGRTSSRFPNCATRICCSSWASRRRRRVTRSSTAPLAASLSPISGWDWRTANRNESGQSFFSFSPWEGKKLTTAQQVGSMLLSICAGCERPSASRGRWRRRRATCTPAVSSTANSIRTTSSWKATITESNSPCWTTASWTRPPCSKSQHDAIQLCDDLIKRPVCLCRVNYGCMPKIQVSYYSPELVRSMMVQPPEIHFSAQSTKFSDVYALGWVCDRFFVPPVDVTFFALSLSSSALSAPFALIHSITKRVSRIFFSYVFVLLLSAPSNHRWMTSI